MEQLEHTQCHTQNFALLILYIFFGQFTFQNSKLVEMVLRKTFRNIASTRSWVQAPLGTFIFYPINHTNFL
jgi:hypothetical protein